LLAAGHLVAIHIKDTLPAVLRGVPFEEGIVPFIETFQVLAQIGFWGPVGVEMWSDMDASGDPLSSAIAARELVEHLITVAWAESNLPGD
jgi:L-ribulose-5-phosphate 3-epimerase